MDYSDYMLINYTIPFIGLVITLIAQIYVNSNYNKYKYERLKKMQNRTKNVQKDKCNKCNIL